MILGIGNSFLPPCSLSLISDYFDKSYRSQVFILLILRDDMRWLVSKWDGGWKTGNMKEMKKRCDKMKSITSHISKKASSIWTLGIYFGAGISSLSIITSQVFEIDWMKI